MEVIVDDGENDQTWNLPKALLFFHAGFFRRANSFNEAQGEQNNYTFIDGFHPKIFDLFISFMLYGVYRHKWFMRRSARVALDAQAWTLADYLDAPEFKNYAMREVYETYCPWDRIRPMASLNAELIIFVCENTPEQSPLWKFILNVAVMYWHDRSVVEYSPQNQEQWNQIWKEHDEIRNALLFATNQDFTARSSIVGVLGNYLEKLPEDDGEK